MTPYAALAALLIGMSSSACAAPTTFNWVSELPDFGGISAIEVTGDGTEFVALGDRCLLLKGTILRVEGRITAMNVTETASLLNEQGLPLQDRPCDSEGLAIGPSGMFISFEGPAAVARMSDTFGVGTLLPSPREFRGMPKNGAFEGLAIGPDGALYTQVEDSGRSTRLPIYKYLDGLWSVAETLPSRSPYQAVGSDWGPDGRFYLLERQFNAFGFRSRISSFDASLADERIEFEGAPGQFGNLEGISLWQDNQGALRAVMVSDNNLLPLFQTAVVEITLGD